MPQFIATDEDGYFVVDGVRMEDSQQGRLLLEHLRVESFQVQTQVSEQEIIVEAFNAPLVAVQVKKNISTSTWQIQLPYGGELDFNVRHLKLDVWDRFHGVCSRGVPFVLSRAAQAELFRLVDDYDDDTLTIDGKKISIEPLFGYNENINWDARYQTDDKPWDLGEVSAPLKNLYFKLKMPKSRILVLGAGSSHDGAFLAEQGHLVTCVDISDTALEQGRALYTKNSNLTFTKANAFSLPSNFREGFDVIIEHTFFCAIPPEERKGLVKVWRQCLRPQGHLLGVFFVMPKFEGPPFGSSEWEIRQYLKNDFQFLVWQRCRDSVPARLGKELVVYAQKK